MASMQSQRGAVHILFLIVVLVIALIFGGLWFTQLQANEQLESKAAIAERDSGEDQARLAWALQWYQEISGKLGAEIPTKIPVPTNENDLHGGLLPRDAAAPINSKIDQYLQSIGARVGKEAARPATLFAAWEIPIGAYNEKDAEVSRLNGEVSGLEKQVEQLNATISSNTQTHEDARSKLKEEYDSNKDRLDAQLTEVRNQNDEMSNKVRDTQDELAQAREQHNTEVQDLTNARRNLEGQVRSIKAEQRIKRKTHTPDGNVVGVDARSGMVFLDIGGKDQLRRGTRFQVFETGKGGVRVAKGWLTVVDVKGDMCEARVDERRGLAIEAGDWVYSPVFDRPSLTNPSGKQRFVFLGEMPGVYSRELAGRILTKNNAIVQDKVTIRTDFLVMGRQESEDADPLTETPEFQAAKTWGVEVIRARDLIPFLSE